MATQDITSAQFNEVISSNDMVIIDFWAEWCGPCKSFAPTYEKVSEKHDDIVFAKVNTELEKYQFKTITKIDYVPHNKVQQYQRNSQVLLLAINKVPSAKGIITGKIFEYLQAKRPILAIGTED